MKKLILASLLLSTLSSTAFASAVLTPTQENSFSGTAGNTSFEAGISPFSFYKFDSTLGNLSNVFVWYNLTIDQGLLGADNLTNDAATGVGYLGGRITLSSDLAFIDNSYQSIFNSIETTQQFNFDLAADPSYSLGGNAPDVQSFVGSEFSTHSGVFALSPLIFSQFEGGASEQFDVDFRSYSVVDVQVENAQGFFQAVDATISMGLQYEYFNNAEVGSTVDVNTPLFGGVGLLIAAALLSGKRRKATR